MSIAKILDKELGDTDNTPWVCKYCGASFEQERALNWHVETDHPNEVY